MNCENAICFALAFFLAHAVLAQSSILSEKRFYNNSIEAAVGNQIEEQKTIYTGPEYTQYFVTKGNAGHPFFQNTQPESITYDGVRYSSVSYVYDTFLDEIIVANPDGIWISVNKNKVTDFSLGGHYFQKINFRDDMPAGFYEILFKHDHISLVARWSKAFKASVWKEEVDFYVIREKAYSFQSKRELLEVLKDKQSEIKNYIRQNNLKFRKNKSSAFTDVVRFYSSLQK